MSRPDIALQINQPKFDTPDEGLQRMLTLRDLIQRGQSQQQQMQLTKQAIDEKTVQAQQIARAQKGQQLYAQLLQGNTQIVPPDPQTGDGGGDVKVNHAAIEKGLYDGGFPELAAQHEEQRQTIEKTAYDLAIKHVEAQGAQAKQLGQLAQSILNVPPAQRPQVYQATLNQVVAGKMIDPQVAAQLPKQYTPDLDPQLQQLADQANGDPLKAFTDRMKEKRDDAAAAALQKTSAAELEAKNVQNESTLLGAARTPEAWTAALDRMGPERAKLYPQTFSEADRKNAVYMGMTPEQRTAMTKAQTPTELAQMAARNEPGARDAMQIMKNYELSLEEGKARAQINAQLGIFGGGMGTGAGAPQAPANGAAAKPGAPQPGAAAAPQSGRNEDYLASLPPGLAAQIKRLSEGKESFPGGFAMRSPYVQNLMAAVGKYDPSFDAINYNSRAKTRADFTSGASAKNITALNTAIEHAGRLENNIDGLGNFQVPYVNMVKNAVERGVGLGGAQNKFNEDVQALTSEATRAWRQAGGSEADIVGWKNGLNSSDSPGALRDSLKEMVELLMSKTKSLHQQYTQGMGTDTSDIPMVSPGASKVLDKLGVENLPEAKSAAPAPAPAPSAKVITSDLMDTARATNKGVDDSTLVDAFVKKGYMPSGATNFKEYPNTIEYDLNGKHVVVNKNPSRMAP